MKRIYSGINLLLFLLLVACSSTGQGPQLPSPNAEYKQLGLVILGDLFGQSSVAATAVFAKYDKALPSSYSQDPITRTASTCTVNGSTSPVPSPNPEPGDDYKLQYLSAGDAVTLKSNGANYATLGKLTQGEGILYTNFGLPKPLPDNLTLDVPGAVSGFPAFSNVPAGSLADLELTAPSLPLTNYITPTTGFSWKKGAVTPATIIIQATAFDVTTTQSTVVVCATPDTGSFSFPETTKTELGSDFKANSLSVSRVSGSLAAKGDALLMVLTTRGVRGSYRGF